MVNHSTTPVRAYAGALIYYLVPLDLEYVAHSTSTDFVRIKVAKVDLTTSMQRIWPYQHIQQFIQLPPTWLGKPIEVTSVHQVLNLL